MTKPREWPAWILVAIFATVVANNAFDYSVLVPQQQLRYEMHDAIVNGTAPLSQRLHAVPFAIEPVIRMLATAMPRDLAFRRAYLAFHFLALLALIASCYAYARLWFTRDQALIGALIIASVVHLVLNQGEYWDFTPIPANSVFAPWSLLEPVFLALILIFAFRRQWGWLSMTIAAAALNSGIAIVLTAVGASPMSTWRDNIAHLPALAINGLLFLGIAVVLVLTGFQRAPQFARRAAVYAAAVAMGLLAIGYWWDFRTITMLYPIVTPLMLSAIFRRSATGPA